MSDMRLVTAQVPIEDEPFHRLIPAGTTVVMPRHCALGFARQLRDIDAPQPRISTAGNYTRHYGGQDLSGKRLIAWRGAGIGDSLIVAGILRELAALYPTARIALTADPRFLKYIYVGAEDLPFDLFPEPVLFSAWDKADYHWVVQGYCDGDLEPDQPDVWDGHLRAINMLDAIPPERRRVFVPRRACWTSRAAATLRGLLEMAGHPRAEDECLRRPGELVPPDPPLLRSDTGEAPIKAKGWRKLPSITAPVAASCSPTPDSGLRTPDSGPPTPDSGLWTPDSLSHPIILWQLSASTPQRSLTPRQTADSVRLLLERIPGAAIIFTARDDEYPAYSEAVDVPGTVGDTRGLGVCEVFALLEMCDLLVCPDSCLGHVSAALDVPTVSYWCPFPSRIRTRNYTNHRTIDLSDTLDCAPCLMHERAPVGQQRGCPLTEVDPSASRYCKGLAAITPEQLVTTIQETI